MIKQNNAHANIIRTHPCFNEAAHQTFGRIHLAVAPACNIQCRYCIRKYDCANESRPGITSTVLAPWEALDRVGSMIERNDRISVIGIAGPGDPLANETTFDVLKSINRRFPGLTLCLSTNGLALPDRLEDLMKSGVNSLTVTINAVTPETAEKVYAWIYYRGKRYAGREAAEILLRNQWRGLEHAIDAGLLVKVNSVLIPGVNSHETKLIAARAGELGADIMNILPLIPQAEFEHLKRPNHQALTVMREQCRPSIPQMTHCRQCRADACGTLGEDKDMETEVLMARIGEEYGDAIM